MAVAADFHRDSLTTLHIIKAIGSVSKTMFCVYSFANLILTHLHTDCNKNIAKLPFVLYNGKGGFKIIRIARAFKLESTQKLCGTLKTVTADLKAEFSDNRISDNKTHHEIKYLAFNSNLKKV